MSGDRARRTPWTADSLLAGEIGVFIDHVAAHAAASCVHHSGSELRAVHGWRAIRFLIDNERLGHLDAAPRK